MPVPRFRAIAFIPLATFALLGAAHSCEVQATADSTQIKTADLNKEIQDFLARQVSAHVEDIKTLDPPPDRVVGALTTGEFSWGTFMRVLAAYSVFAHTQTVAGHDVVPMIAKMAPIELGQGGKAWAQLYAALALRSFGTDLNHNALWQSLSDSIDQAGIAGAGTAHGSFFESTSGHAYSRTAAVRHIGSPSCDVK